MVLIWKRIGRVGRRRFTFLMNYYFLKSGLKIPLTLIKIILLCTYSHLYAYSINPHLVDTVFQNERIYLSYEEFSRKTEFFFGYKEDINIKTGLLNYTRKNISGLEYALGIGLSNADLDGRSSRKHGYDIRVSFSNDIGGDLFILPLCKWYFDVSGGNYCLDKYMGNKIDIDYRFYSVNLALILAKNFGLLIPYGGVKFSYIMDKYIERVTDLSYSSETSGFSLLSGLKLKIYKGLNVSCEMQIINERGSSASLEYIY